MILGNRDDSFFGRQKGEQDVRQTLKNMARIKPAKTREAGAAISENKIPEEKRNHQAGLERANAAAGVVDSHHTGADFNDIAVLDGRHAEKAQDIHDHRGVRPA